MLLLWCRPAATAPFRLLAWESPYAAGMALKRQKTKRKEKKKNLVFFLVHEGIIFLLTGPTLKVRILFFFSFLSFFLSFFFGLFRAILVVFGGSKANGPIGAAAVGLYHSHSNARYQLSL